MYAPAHVRSPRPELRVFLDDLRAEPENDGLRLILADWLTDQEHDEDTARADLIRLQCAMRRLGQRYTRLHRREQQLISEWSWAWLGDLAKIAAPWQIDRGTVRLTIQAEAFFNPKMAELCRSEAYAWVDSVAVTGLTPGAMGPLVEQPLLARVREVSFQEGRIGNAGLSLLASSPHLGELRILRLAQCGVGARATQPLTWSLPHLHTLDLSQNHLWDETLMNLLTNGLPSVRHLQLGYNNLSNEGMQRLADSSFAQELVTLDVGGNRTISDVGLIHIAELPLIHLNVSQSMPNAIGMRALGEMQTIEDLGLNRCELGDSRFKELLFASGLRRLHSLRAGRALLGDESMIALFTGPQRRWQRLELANNHIGPRGVDALAESPDAMHLMELKLAGNPLGDVGAFALARSPNLESLRWLDVAGCGMSPAGLAALIRRFGASAVTA